MIVAPNLGSQGTRVHIGDMFCRRVGPRRSEIDTNTTWNCGDNAKDGVFGMSYHLIDVVQQLGQPRILVLGDVILDRYVWGDADRISQEAPVVLLREERRESRLGGAANVANMLRGLNVDVTMAGVVGDDAGGATVREHLTAAGVDCAGLIVDGSRPTTVKERFIGRAQHRHPHQMLRVDREVRTPIDEGISSQLFNSLLPQLGDFQAILVSDYAKGVCTPEVLSRLIAAAREAAVPVVVDPAATGDYSAYRGATAITPNRLETSRATNRAIETPDDAFDAGRVLCRQLDLKHAFVTLDSDGIALVKPQGEAEMFPTRRREVYDITGAGDMVLATIGVGTAAGISPEDVARLANVAGGLEVEQIGVVTISRDEILADLMKTSRGTKAKICSRDELARHVAARKRLGQKVVLTNGCFDLLHVGHVSYLEQAAREGDCLIVAINSDDSIRRLGKGPDRPLFDESQRTTMLAALESIDYVVVFDESTPHTLLEVLQPDVLVKGGTYADDEIVGREVVQAYGGEARVLGVTPGVSTTDIVHRLRNEQAEASFAIDSRLSPLDSPTETRRKAG